MKCVVWGTGNYCKEKIDYLVDYEIVAFVERKKAIFRGIETILPSDIKTIQFDKIIIMSKHYLEIIPEILELGISSERIIPGIICKPYLSSELELVTECSEISVKQNGTLLYRYNNEEVIISKNKDWELVKKLITSVKNEMLIRNLSVQPVGKMFGLNRGGSIGRYYIDKFIEKNKKHIRGNVLEIGDRNYSKRYMENISNSFCLHFDKNFKNDAEFDFCGDLRDGRNIKKNFYDCIILTQVLNFVENIEKTPKILLDSLKKDGVLLVTVSGITPISRYDMNRWGHFWNFTSEGIRSMFSLKGAECEIQEYGNFKVACAFLGGMSYVELTENELEIRDNDFPVIITAIIRKTGK